MMAAKRSLGRPSREEAAEIENEILDAANELFCAQGFVEASPAVPISQIETQKR